LWDCNTVRTVFGTAKREVSVLFTGCRNTVTLPLKVGKEHVMAFPNGYVRS